MFMYKIEIGLTDGKAYLIVCADSDEKAFGYVEGHIARHFVKLPEITEQLIVEKKRIAPGAGYVIEAEE